MAEQFNIRYCLETGWPKGRRRKPAEKGLTGMDWECFGALPFLPRNGDMILVHAEDDFRRVEQVFIYASTDPHKVEIFFEFQESVDHQSLVDGGWKEC